MRKVLFLLLLILSKSAYAQDTKGDIGAINRVALAAYVPLQIENMPETARSLLVNKLNQIVTQNGLGGRFSNERFILTANINVLSRDIVTTTTSMTALVLEVTLYIGDGIEGTKFSSISTELKGVGESETKAYIAALRNLKTADPKYQTFIEAGEAKIIAYFNANCDNFLREAHALAGQNKFDEALYTLFGVPEVCGKCYQKATAAIIPIFKQQIEWTCKTNLANARSAWSSSQDINGAKTASNFLRKIDPNSSCYQEAQELTTMIGHRIYEIDQREWDFKLQQYEATVDVTKTLINAARDVGVAYASSRPKTVVYNIRGWWY